MLYSTDRIAEAAFDTPAIIISQPASRIPTNHK